MDQHSRIFDKAAAALSHLLEQGEKLHSLGHKPDEKFFSQILDRARRELDELEKYVHQTGRNTTIEGVLANLGRRLARLSFIPIKEVIVYTQNLLCFSNLCLADGEWAFDSHHRSAGLSGFAVIDCAEHVLFHHLLNQDIAREPRVWEDAVLHGKYVLCYDLIITQAQLLMTGKQCGLAAPILIGGHFADLLALCSVNVGLFASVHTTDFVLGVPQPNAVWLFSPELTVLERALTMLHTIQSIAQDHQI